MIITISMKKIKYEFKSIFSFIISISLIFSAHLIAQEKEKDMVKETKGRDIKHDNQNDSLDLAWKPCISPYFELMGKGWLSLNVDFRRKETYAISIAAAILEEGVGPNVMGYYFGGKRHRLEVGGGFSGIIADGGFNSLMVHGVIGYRKQNKQGLLFRTGFTPMFQIPFTVDGKYAFIPWAGISLGYSF
jgi:hypothetical protein